MRLNRDQAKHFSDTLRTVAIAQFGFFGYHGLVEWATQRFTFVWSAALFSTLEWFAIRLLGED